MTRAISWKVTKREFNLIDEIADRAARLAMRADIEYDRRTAAMDLTATHANGCPLRLDELLAAPDFDFSHDVFGIRRNINRDTGQLENFFTPRFAR